MTSVVGELSCIRV